MEIKFRMWADLNQHIGSVPEMLYWQPVAPPNNPDVSLNNYLWNNGGTGKKVMQFTGFEHKGVEIYDKDILRFTNSAPGKKWQKSHGDKNYNDMVVSWNAKRGMWAVYWQNAAGELCWSSLSKALTPDHEIVGNIHENPELVK